MCEVSDTGSWAISLAPMFTTQHIDLALDYAVTRLYNAAVSLASLHSLCVSIAGGRARDVYV
jgi:hypothetical protein